MNHTQNYQLSLWEKTDKVLMDDFNEDNRKIDAALTGKLGPMELIYESDIGQSFRDSHTVDMSFIDWNDWSIVVFMFLAYHIGSDDSATLRMDLSGTPATHGANLANGKPNPRMVIFLPCRGAGNPLRLVCIPNGEVSYGEGPFSELTALRFHYSGSGYMSNASKVVFYGIR